MKVVEAYYTARHLSALLSFSEKWVLERVKCGDFGPGCVLVKGDYRVPASGVNAWLDRHQVRLPEPTAARNAGELRRKFKESPNV